MRPPDVVKIDSNSVMLIERFTRKTRDGDERVPAVSLVVVTGTSVVRTNMTLEQAHHVAALIERTAR